MRKWKRLESKMVYQNADVTVHEDQVIRPDGTQGIYGWVESPPAVLIVAISESNEIYLVRQERYTTGTLSWELPGGSTGGLDALDAAKRELRAETGLHADSWERIGEYYPLNGLSTQRNEVFMARGLHKARDVEEALAAIDSVRAIARDELATLIETGEIKDGETLAALMLASKHLQ